MTVGDQIAVQRTKRRELSGPRRRLVRLFDDLGIVGILSIVAHQIHEIVLNIIRSERSQCLDLNLHNGNSLRFFQVFKENLDVSDISQDSSRRFVLCDQIFIGESADKHRQVHGDVVDLLHHSVIFFIAVFLHSSSPSHKRSGKKSPAQAGDSVNIKSFSYHFGITNRYSLRLGSGPFSQGSA